MGYHHGKFHDSSICQFGYLRGGGGGSVPPSQLIPQKPGMNRVKKAPSIYSRRALDDVLIKLTHTLVRQQRGPGKFFNINCLIWDTSNRS